MLVQVCTRGVPCAYRVFSQSFVHVCLCSAYACMVQRSHNLSVLLLQPESILAAAAARLTGTTFM
jgi:hypothetical protein